MTGRAIPIDFPMIERATHKSCRRMAEVAIQGGRHMILCFTLGSHAVAGLAIVHDAGVIESRAVESVGGMAHTAILVGDDMPVTLAFGKHTIVTGLTVIHDANVIKGCRQESGRYMALTAILVGRNVIVSFATGYVAIVA
jgi:hypothetical protein